MKIVFLALLLTVPATAADEMTTCGMVNGRGWKSMDQKTKYTYLRGISDAMAGLIMQGHADARPSHFAEHFTPEEIATALDRLFADPANVLVPVAEQGLRVVAMQLTDKPAAEIADTLSKSRKLAAFCQDQTR